MNKIYIFFLLIITHSLCSQNLRISYEYKFVQDSLNINNISNELVLLDITEKGSIFYSRSQYLNDSLAFYSNKNNTIQSDINFSVKKNLSNTTYVNSQIGNINYTFQEKDDLKWKISSEKKQILGYNVQKATLKFGGRNWTAWFSNDLPIQDGPYIFRGLPGLILSIEDTQKYHVFNIIGVEKKEVPFEIEKLSTKILSKKEFNKQWHIYKIDPNATLRSLSSSTNTKFSIEWNGEKLNQNEIYKREEERAKKEVLYKNNFLDLNLYK